MYSKPGCHLCDEMKAVVAAVLSRRAPISFEEIDISKDPDLLERFGLEIPVLMADGKKIAKYRITEADLTRVLGGVGF